MKKSFCVLGLMLVSTQFAQVSNASLYAVVTLYTLIFSGDPYLENNTRIQKAKKNSQMLRLKCQMVLSI